MLHTNRYQSPVGRTLAICLLPFVTVYYEIVFKLSTVGGFWETGTVYTLLFSLALGGISYLLVTCTRKRKVSFWLTLVLIFLCAVPFLIEYFIFRQFKIFYDLGSMVSNGSDAVSGFSAEIRYMVFSWDGFVKISLFLLPTVLYGIFGRFLAPYQKSDLPRRSAVITATVLIFLGTGLSLEQQPYLGALYSEEYRFQEAVSEFGVLTAFRLDVQNMFREDSGGFEIDVTVPQVTQSTTAATEPTGTDPAESEVTETEATEPPVVYTPNEMMLSFNNSVSDRVTELNTYVQSLTPSMKNAYTGMFAGKNLILITAEAFTAEVIDPELTPTLYRLATKGIQFTDYYQTASAGTTGGEYLNIFGMLPTDAGNSFKNTADHLNYFTMGSQLDRLGYFGQAYHNNSYTYYSRNKTHNNLGYSAGFMGYGNGMEAYVTKQWPQSDLQMIQGTLELYLQKQPFNVYYMTVSGHSNYDAAGNRIVRENWDRVAHLPYSDIVKGYYAAQLGLEDALTYLVQALEEAGIADNTVICLTTDHFPYGLQDDVQPDAMYYIEELYGYSIDNYFQRDHSRLILWCGELEDADPIVVDTPTSVIDILPTLSNLFGTDFDTRLMPGRDVFSDAPALVFNANYDWKTEYGTYIAKENSFTPADSSVTVPEGYVTAMKQIVKNKIRYCQGVLDTDYFRTLFPNG